LRAITGLPLGKPTIKGRSAMVNLVGTERNNEWLGVPVTELVWYGKEVLPGRKVGHINITNTDETAACASLEALRPHLPDHYNELVDGLAQPVRSKPSRPPPTQAVGRARSNLMVGPLQQPLDHRHQAQAHRSTHPTGDHVSQERHQDTGNARNTPSRPKKSISAAAPSAITIISAFGDRPHHRNFHVT